MSQSFDVVVIGSGPGGRGAAGELNNAGLSVAMVEEELVGGECPFWACIPSKTLLRPAELVGEVEHVDGVADPKRDWDAVVARRDYMNSALDDTSKYEHFSGEGIAVIRGRARLEGPGTVIVEPSDATPGGGESHELVVTRAIVLATGTTAVVPDLPGIEEVDAWTNREAVSLREVPTSAVVVGGGPVGVELAQMLHRHGSRVTLVVRGPRVLEHEEDAVGDQLNELLSADGIDLRTEASAASVERTDAGMALVLEDGTRLEAERLVVATGRRPRVEDLGLESAGVEISDGFPAVDERFRAAEGVYAVGDMIGRGAFTHVASYQATIASFDILGKGRDADLTAVPRVVFSDPEVACVGLTSAEAEEQGMRPATTTVDLSQTDRTDTYGTDLVGHLTLVADAERGVLVGASAVGPLASEWLGQLVLAVKVSASLDLLSDTIAQFPSFSELIPTAARQLADEISTA